MRLVAFLTLIFSVKQGQASTKPTVVGIPVAAGFSICKTDSGSFVVTDVTSHIAAIQCMAVDDVVVSIGNRMLTSDDSLDHVVQLFKEPTSGHKELVVRRTAGSGVVTRFTIRLQRAGQGLQNKMAAAGAPMNVNHLSEHSLTFSGVPYPQNSEKQPATAALARFDEAPLSSSRQTTGGLSAMTTSSAASCSKLSHTSSQLSDDEFTDDETVDMQLSDSGYAMSHDDKFQGQTSQTQIFAGWPDEAASVLDVPDGWEGIASYCTYKTSPPPPT